MILTSLDKYRDEGLLLLRLGLGAMFIFHGLPKILGGPETWAKLGGAMANFGLSFAPAFWGLMSAAAEFGGALCLISGFLMRPACALLVINLTVAATMHLSMGQGFGMASHAIEDGIVFLSLLLIGPGKYALDTRLTARA
jgi:putative oxidoreductase